MKRLILVGALLLVIAPSNGAMAAGPQAWVDGWPGAWASSGNCDPYVDFNCAPPKVPVRALRGEPCDPYVNYNCLDAYLGDDFVTRFYRYYQLEWGKAVAPSDPKAPPGRRSDAVWPPTPQSTPPMPFTEWPYGGSQAIGVTRPNSVDSPLMVALGNTELGHAMNDAHVQVYGWVAPAGNISTNKVRPGGNAPAAYDYTPNTVQLDQAVVYIERLADTVQNDHFDWGFRFATLYGVDYRYTTAYGLFSGQLLNKNSVNGIDFPMAYVDLYFPVMLGLDIRLGRFISIPDIEAQLAPNNYTYVHSLTYTFDNYTNTGLQATLAVTKNWMVQLGLTVGSDTMPWRWGAHIPNLYVQSGSNAAGFGPGQDPLYTGARMLRDPGAMPSGTVGLRWTSDDGRDDLNVVMDAWNDGVWGYNNLQWVGLTYYHKFNDYWHIAFEIVEHSRARRTEPQQSCGSRTHCQWRHSVQPAIYALQRPERGVVQKPCGVDLHRGRTNLSHLHQLFAEQVEQLFSAHRIFRRSARTTHRRRDSICRYRVQLAALVLASNRDPSRDRLLSLPRRPGLQWQRQRGNRSQQELRRHWRHRPHHSLLS